MDFTFKTYEKLLNSLLARGFSFITFAQYIQAKSSNPQTFTLSEVEVPNLKRPAFTLSMDPVRLGLSGAEASRSAERKTPQPLNNSTDFTLRCPEPAEGSGAEGQQANKLTAQQAKNLIILRHDVEARYPNALRMAKIEHTLGIKGSYYFRILLKPGNEEIIKQIAAMGHEIGYHYDDLTACKGNHEKALLRFQKNLTYLRQFAPVTTITMEGAPLSKYDNRDLWNRKKAQTTPKTSAMRSAPCLTPSQPHYTQFGILAEPYFDINFNHILYLTDTGRRWDGHRYNVRDRATKENPVTNPVFLKLRFHSTFDLINAINSRRSREHSDSGSTPQQINKLTSQQANPFPNQAMLNFHPQRWNKKPLPWIKELIWQNVKNQGKRILLKLRNGD